MDNPWLTPASLIQQGYILTSMAQTVELERKILMAKFDWLNFSGLILADECKTCNQADPDLGTVFFGFQTIG